MKPDTAETDSQTATRMSPSTALSSLDPMAEMIQAEAERLLVEYESDQAAKSMDLQTFVATWYLGECKKIEAVEAMIRDQAQTLLRQCEARRKALEWRWGSDFKTAVDAKLRSQGGRKKSIDFLTGRAGYRTGPSSLEIVDEQKAIAWCKVNCPEALEPRIARKTPLKEHFEATGEEVPGTIFHPSVDRFYPSIGRPALESIRTPHVIEA